MAFSCVRSFLPLRCAAVPSSVAARCAMMPSTMMAAPLAPSVTVAPALKPRWNSQPFAVMNRLVAPVAPFHSASAARMSSADLPGYEDYDYRPPVPTPRSKAPAFKSIAVVKEEFKEVVLSDYDGKWVYLLFYPFDFTFVCPTEITGFSDNIQKFRDINTEVLAISTDSHHSHLAWVKQPRADGGLANIDIPLVADFSKDIARAYGVLVDDAEDPMNGAALRGLFLIDPKGKVRSVTINDDHAGRSVEEALRTVKAFQFADEHGAVCPAQWKDAGDATITPDPQASKSYFKKNA